MKKGELLQFLEPFNDDVEVVIRPCRIETYGDKDFTPDYDHSLLSVGGEAKILLNMEKK